MCQHLADILGKQAKQLVFYRCQVKFFIIKVNTARNIVYPQSAVDKLRDRDIFGLHKPPLYHPEPCEKLIDRERFCQVIICTFVKCCYFIPVLAPCTDYDNRNIAPSAYMLYDLNAVNIRQSKVKYDDVRLVRSTEHDRFIAPDSGDKAIVIHFQCRGYKISDGLVILHHQNKIFIHSDQPLLLAE